MSKIKEKINKLPTEPGVYIFKDKFGKILYIGKATSLRSRVKSYFQGRDVRGERILSMVRQVADIKTQQTDSVLEALILESNLIKKHQPKYNIDLKDGKSFSYFVITKEKFPRVIILRKTDLGKNKNITRYTFGPYTSKKQMEIALKIIRHIFPFHLNKQQSENGCLDFQIGLCPGPYAGAISGKDYMANIRNIRMILAGKKKGLINTLEKEMQTEAKKHEFEKAAELRNKIFALQHIRDIALITKDFEENTRTTNHEPRIFRIEAYDISNISGTNAVGSMVVFSNNKPDKSQYRKFRIKTVAGIDDVKMMREILIRRFNNEWPMPDLILLDGGIGHLNMADRLLHKKMGLAVSIAAVAKGPMRKNVKIKISNDKSILNSQISNEIEEILDDKNLIKGIMDEAHRFAINFHRKIRKKNALI
ncbi:MAG TPA: GIY-YIG nuclease family protein [Candidatus Moranbacteria bacterium]|nr:GIY-YIG nuclease family protein [Candidatus Moranbacteria bacterium]HRZ33967.1 GIY-YIG nuclease family protein [Candidatus Moranbacteria bacterium]